MPLHLHIHRGYFPYLNLFHNLFNLIAPAFIKENKGFIHTVCCRYMLSLFALIVYSQMKKRIVISLIQLKLNIIAFVCIWFCYFADVM